MDQKPIVYLCSSEYLSICDKHPKILKRASMVHSLIQTYSLLDKDVAVVAPRQATKYELQSFHTDDYISYVEHIQQKMSCNNVDGECANESIDLDDFNDSLDSYGLGYDCAIFGNIYDYMKAVAGATLTAAEIIANHKAKIVVNFNGGWHHGHVGEAAGFCYVNDIVIGILKLQENFKRILYVDMDIHHGDGVEEAFQYSNKVFTLSFHKCAEGFFPGSGSVSDIGRGSGKFHALNVPLRDGVTDSVYCRIFDSVIDEVVTCFKPEVVVIQNGADALSRDPMGTFNLTSSTFCSTVKKLLSYNKPAILLGGGGYNLPNTARCWTKVFAEVVGKEISDDIPVHHYFDQYGPDYCLSMSPSNRKNENTQEYIDEVIETAKSHLYELRKKYNTECGRMVPEEKFSVCENKHSTSAEEKENDNVPLKNPLMRLSSDDEDVLSTDVKKRQILQEKVIVG